MAGERGCNLCINYISINRLCLRLYSYFALKSLFPGLSPLSVGLTKLELTGMEEEKGQTVDTSDCSVLEKGAKV